MSPEPQIAVRFTPSELMALLDILVFYMRHPEEPQEFIDCARDITTPSQLLLKIVSCNSSHQEAIL